MPKESQQIKITSYHERSHTTQQDVEQDLYNLGLLSRYACRARWPDWGRMPLLDTYMYMYVYMYMYLYMYMYMHMPMYPPDPLWVTRL